MALGTPVVGTTAYSASAGTTVAPAYPAGMTAGDALVMFVGQKPGTANGGTTTTPTGWTLREELNAAGGYGTTLGADTGNTNLRAYTKDTVTGSESGTLSVTLGTNGVTWAFMVRVPTGGGTLSYGSADGQRTTTPTSPMAIALTNGASATAFQTGDKAIWAMCIPTDVTTPSQFSAQSITATGATFGTATELNEPDSSTGNDIGGYSAWAHVNSGSSSTAPTVTTTVAGTRTNVRGPVVLVRIRETPATALTGNSAAQPNTSTAGSVSQSHQVSGNSAASTPTATAGAVTQTHLLTGANAAQPNTTTAGSVFVVSDVTLAGNNAAQPNATTVAAISQTHLLAGNAARQNATSTAGAITQTHLLAGAFVVQVNTSTSAAIGQTHRLTGANLAQPATSSTGAVALGTVTTLTGNNCAATPTATAGAITQTHRLTGDYVLPGYVQPGYVLSASAQQINTASAGAITLGDAPQPPVVAGGGYASDAPWHWVPFTPTHPRRPRKRRQADLLFL